MPAKLEKCVTEVKAQGKTEQQAYAICTAATKDIMFDKGFESLARHIDKATGFLHLHGVIARDGIQKYLGCELGDGLEPMKEYGVLRPTEEVLKKSSLDSFVNMPITDDHPVSFVTVDNAKDLIKGSIANYELVKKDGSNFIKAKIIITDKDLINKVINGKVELSAGYTQKLIPEEGTWNGQKYQFKQTDIKINHIAIVKNGRCGGDCKLTVDGKTKQDGGEMAQITIGGVNHEINDCVAKYISGLNATITAKDSEIGELVKAKETADEALKAKPATENIEDKVRTLVFLQDQGVDAKVSDQVIDMKKTYLESKGKTLDGKSDAYIDAAFDLEVEKIKTMKAEDAKKKEEAKKSQDAAQEGFKSGVKDSNFVSMAKEEY